jgi:CRISPR-associated exonuclease Cas4
MISVSDVKQYFYCPRIIYFAHVLNIEKGEDAKRAAGKEVHGEIERLEKRRKTVLRTKQFGDAEKRFRVYLESEKLGMKGLLDCLLIVNSDYIPLEYKFTRTGKYPFRNHKYQLAAYALLVEDMHDTTVKKGYIYYDLDKSLKEVAITPVLRSFVKKGVARIKSIIENEEIPGPTRMRGRCRDCEYLNVCEGV